MPHRGWPRRPTVIERITTGTPDDYPRPPEAASGAGQGRGGRGIFKSYKNGCGRRSGGAELKLTEEPGESRREGVELLGAIRSRRARLFIVGALVLAYMALGTYFHLVLGISIAYTHFAYISIVISGIWWGRRAILVAAVLGCEILAFRLFHTYEGPLWADLARIAFFLVMAAVVGELSRKVMMTQAALRDREERLRKTNASLRELSKLRRDFLHIAVHDLKSPISATKMLLHSLETLSGEKLDEREAHLVERMHDRLDEATSFLRDFQFFAALEDTSQVRKHAGPVDLGSVARKAVEAHRDLSGRKGHSLACEVPEEVPVVMGVERLLVEVVSNLVSNAIKYTPDGGQICVRVLPGESLVRVEVEDTGIGVSEEDQKLLFREFSRIKRKQWSGEKVPGIGLGLSIVKRIVDMHGGRVSVHSEPEKGSVFAFELPCCGRDEEPSVKLARRLEPPSGP